MAARSLFIHDTFTAGYRPTNTGQPARGRSVCSPRQGVVISKYSIFSIVVVTVEVEVVVVVVVVEPVQNI